MTAGVPAVGGVPGVWDRPVADQPARGVTASFAAVLARAVGPSATAARAVGRPSVTLGEMLGRLPGGVPAAGAAPLPDASPASGAPMTVPASGRVSSEYGPRVHPITGQHRPHTGIDVAAPTGTPVRAAAAGTVTFAGSRGGYGNLVIVDHGGGRETYYAHNSANHVAVGDRVVSGQDIAAVGATGMATGPHLHFEVRVDGEPVEPRDHVHFG